MSETQQPERCLAEEALQPIPTPLTPWTLRARHRRPAVVFFIALLILLQLVLAGIVMVQVRRLLDLEERIELLEKRHATDPE